MVSQNTLIALLASAGVLSVTGYEYVGCYTDDDNRDLQEGPMSYGYTKATCSQACADYNYFALQNNGWCVCGDDYGTEAKYSQRPDSECGSDRMGRGWRNAVFAQGQCTVQLFEHDNFDGSSHTYDQGNFAHVDSHDSMSSMTVSPGCTATVYEHYNYGGWSVTLHAGRYTMGDLNALGFRNDQVSSLKVAAAMFCQPQPKVHGRKCGNLLSPAVLTDKTEAECKELCANNSRCQYAVSGPNWCQNCRWRAFPLIPAAPGPQEFMHIKKLKGVTCPENRRLEAVSADDVMDRLKKQEEN